MTKANELIEHAIMGKLIEAMIGDGFRIELCDQDGGGLFLYAAPDAEEIPTVGPSRGQDGAQFWVRLCPGNGPDLIIDYTTNLETTLKPVNAFAAAWGD